MAFCAPGARLNSYGGFLRSRRVPPSRCVSRLLALRSGRTECLARKEPDKRKRMTGPGLSQPSNGQAGINTAQETRTQNLDTVVGQIHRVEAGTIRGLPRRETVEHIARIETALLARDGSAHPLAE